MDKILFVITNHDELNNGAPTGVWLEEYAVPFMIWRYAGYEIDVVSLKGGRAPVDPYSMPDKGYCTEMFRDKMDSYTRQLSEAQSKLEDTICLIDVDASQYLAVYYPGGHGCLWDVCQKRESVRLLEDFILQEKPIFAICHASGVLAAPKGDDGLNWIKDRSVTGFSNAEEAFLGLEDEIPFSVEDKLIDAGALYSCEKPAGSFVIEDGRLVTGQNAKSSWELAKKALHVLDDMYVRS
ncbi:MAG: type 1 glutamine amidotransferase domain-containing protein [Thermoguttaceae bacterium]|nr:type 1 glutamine amidotransferase domain-containing protein [Thermoguttaceae bacterium]